MSMDPLTQSQIRWADCVSLFHGKRYGVVPSRRSSCLDLVFQRMHHRKLRRAVQRKPPDRVRMAARLLGCARTQ
jgi:hypothetical protein